MKYTNTFCSFSVDDLDKAATFYGQTLGLPVEKTPQGLDIHLPGNAVFLYPKPNHSPATFTVFNFKVADIEAAVDELTAKGVAFQHYSGQIATDARGIHRGGDQEPTIAWFTDPAGNILSVVQEGKA